MKLNCSGFAIIFNNTSNYKGILRYFSTGTVNFQNRRVRCRFAPSPTGDLHLGGFRTALLNYLFAKKSDGDFILRIEDTDQSRKVPHSIQLIQEDLNWLGLIPNESPGKGGPLGPYIQSERLDIYNEQINKLIDNNLAYECFCTEKRLDLIRKEAVRARQNPAYDNKCRDLTKEERLQKKLQGIPHCIRFKLILDDVEWEDMICGKVRINLKEASQGGDPILLKSDGFPTYHFANIVDDHFMDISHVLRGVEWLVSTPKHIKLYKAFKWNMPIFGHLPLIMNSDGTKLSKRQSALSISHYRNNLYYPTALINFVTKSGGGFDKNHFSDITNYSLEELSEKFDISSVNKHSCRIDFNLLNDLNKANLKNLIQNDLQNVLNSFGATSTLNENLVKEEEDYVKKVLIWAKDRIVTVKDLNSDDFNYLFTPNKIQKNTKINKIKTDPHLLMDFVKKLNTLPLLPLSSASEDLQIEAIVELIKNFSDENKMEYTRFMKDLRLALCDLNAGPPIAEVIQLFDLQKCSSRLANVIDYLLEMEKNAKMTKNGKKDAKSH